MTRELDILILGAGWSATFLIPLLQARSLSFAATTTTGHEVAGVDTLPFKFDQQDLSNEDQAKVIADLPRAKHLLITFPLKGSNVSKYLHDTYNNTHKSSTGSRWIQFGSTGIWQIPQPGIWVSRRSAYKKDDARAIAEDELLDLGGCVMNLAGLWGGERDPKQWVSRVATTKEGVKSKKSLHMIHGMDVARAVLAVMGCQWSSMASGQRWMLTDGFVYDWWSLFAGWADVELKAKGADREDGQEADRQPSDQARWVYELMLEEKIWALPRSMEALGRCYFGREFWDAFQLAPLKARI